MFLDKIKLTLKSGKGGNGMIHLKRTSMNPKAGPDGGNGGNGGDIYLFTDINIKDLSHLASKKIYNAGDGENGKQNNCNGKKGHDLILKVPVGTVVTFLDNQEKIDLDKDGILYKILDGGRGGYGNAHFVSSVRRTPRFAEIGELGKILDVQLDLKLIADVAIIGLPNAGKSTFISSISNAKPKIADYPFTTLIPHLGVVTRQNKTFVCADIPGLIEGAHKGKGLGIDFLKHIERCRIILHLISADSDDMYRDFCIVENELKKYSKDLYKKKRIVAISKMDIVGHTETSDIVDFKNRLKKFNLFCISSVTHFNIDILLDTIYKELQIIKVKKTSNSIKPILNAQQNIVLNNNDKVLAKVLIDNPNIPVYTLRKYSTSNIKNFTINKINKKWVIDGYRINQIANMTDQNNPEGMQRLYDILKKIGIGKYLKKYDILPNDIISVGDKNIAASNILDFDI